MLDSLVAKGFQVEFLSHARAILSVDFPDALAELESALASTTIPIEEIIAGGGGEAKGTQRLRKTLAAMGWPKTVFRIERRINDVPRESQSHEIDHVEHLRVARASRWKLSGTKRIPFYYRDLENFKRLHADGAISVGIIVTRGKSLHVEIRRDLVRRFLDERQIDQLDDLRQWGYYLTTRNGPPSPSG